MDAKVRDWIGGVGCALGSLAAGSAGSFFTGAAREWYLALGKPWWTPPSWLFGPVWTVLYLVMGTALWLIVRNWRDLPRARAATVAWGVQLALNVAWTPVFFGLRSPAGGLVVLALMWPAIAATVALAARVSWTAAALLVPYLAWVTFAAALNAAIVMLN